MSISTLLLSLYPNVTEDDLINSRKLVEQQKNQRAEKILKKRILKQTYVIKIAESLSTITKKLDELKESTQKLGHVIKKTILPN